MNSLLLRESEELRKPSSETLPSSAYPLREFLAAVAGTRDVAVTRAAAQDLLAASKERKLVEKVGGPRVHQVNHPA